MKKIILAENMEKGIAIVAVDDKMFAYTNGKYYSTRDYRPINGDGRQLRDDSREIIKTLLPEAMEAMEHYKALEKAELDVAIAAMPTPEAPRTNFADALQDAFLKTLTEKAATDMTDEIYPIVEKMVVEKFGILPVVHEFRLPEKPPYEFKEVLHADFDKIVSMVADSEPIYLYGPAGTGKSYMAQQIAKVLNLEYYYTNSVTDEVQIKGFVDANGNYHKTQFYDAFVNGGIFLLDELDGSIPETLVMLNNALANGYFAFPNGKAEAHKDFRCIAAGNTFGTGADNTYTGRYQLDGASMDRFALIEVNYDERIEENISGGDKELVAFAHDFRNAVNKIGSTCLFTYRGIKRLKKFSAYMDYSEAIRIGLTKGLASDDIQLIYRNLVNKENTWAKALEAVSKKK